MLICPCIQRKYAYEENCIDKYYFKSELYPSISNRENLIITAETTMDCFVEYCLKNNIKAFDKRSIDSIVAVAMATKIGNISLIDGLVKKIGLDILNTYDENYFTPLHITCHETRVKNGVYDIKQLCKGVQRLIELGANPNVFSKEGFTPLSTVALRADNAPLIDLLIRNQGKVTSCVSHLKEFVEGEGFISAEATIKENIKNVQKDRLLYIYS